MDEAAGIGLMRNADSDQEGRRRPTTGRAGGPPRARGWGAAVVACACFAVVVILGGCTANPRAVAAAGVTTERDQPVDTLALMREAADHEALYTLAGGLKPMSTGIWRGSFTLDDPDLSQLRAVRAALAPLRNDLWYADVQVFDDVYDGERTVHAFVVHRASFAAMIERYADFWSARGITTGTHPSEVLAVVDRMPKADRWRGYGYLFGYPADAVNFFVDAGLAAADGGEVGPGKDRRFVHIPTFAAETGRFTYAVPLDHNETTADASLAAGASLILTAYADRRERMVDARGMVAELRRLNRLLEGEAAARASHSVPRPPAEAPLGGVSQ